MSQEIASLGNKRLRELLEQVEAQAFGNAEEALAALMSGNELLGQADGEWERGLLEVEQARLQSICGHHRQSLKLAERSLERFRAVNNRPKQISAMNIISLSHNFLGAAGESFRWGKEALQLAREEKLDRAVAVLANNLGLHLSYIGETDWALHYYEMGLEAARGCGEREQLENLYHNLAILYSNVGNSKAAFDFLNRSEELIRNSGDDAKMGSHLINRADLLIQEMHLEEALKDLEEGEALLAKGAAFPHKRAHAQELKGKIYAEQGDGEQARQCLLAALAVYEDFGIPRGKLMVQVDLAKLIDQPVENRLEVTLHALRLAEELEQKPVQMELHKLLRDLYRTGERYREALDHLEKAMVLEGQVRSEKVDRHSNLLRVLHEVEEAREAGSEERKRAQRMEGELRVIAQERAESERLHARKSEIVRLAAHDLKNMSSGLVSLAELARQTLDKEELPDRQALQELLQPMATEARELHQTIGHVLDANLLERGLMRLQWERLRIAPMLERVVTAYQRRAEEKSQQIVLRSTGDGEVKADPIRLRQVWENLLSNALKYSPPGERIELHIRQTKEAVRVDFLDRGPGLGPEEVERIGQPMTRLSAEPTGGESSHGLGLYIVKQLLDQFGGQLQVSARDGGGSCFRVELPRVVAEQEASVGKALT